MLMTITAQHIVKFTASAKLHTTHLKFTRSHYVVSFQTLRDQTRLTCNSDEDEGKKRGKYKVRVKCDDGREEVVQYDLYLRENYYIHSKRL